MFSGVVCLGAAWWTVLALGQVKLADADTAGVLSVGPGLVGAVVGGWGLWVSVRGLRIQRTEETVAVELARAVTEVEGDEYKQLLGSGLVAPGGRIDLAFTATATGMSNVPSDGTLEGITDFYRNLRPGRMVITGTPPTTGGAPDAGGPAGGDAGAGKTVLALALLLGLARERAAGEPVPVRLTAASWPGGEVRQWLYTHLTGTYYLSPHDAALLLDADLVLPVIDGLDEMDPGTAPGYTSRAASLLHAVERFESGGMHCRAVLTCRYAHYQALVDADAQPRVVAHLALARVDPARARAYLEQRVAATDQGRARWRRVIDALETAATGAAAPVVGPDGEAPATAGESMMLARALDTPWRLTLAAVVFQERSPDSGYLRNPADLVTLAASGRLHGYLLDRYIGAAVGAPHHETSDPAPGTPAGQGRPRHGRRPPQLDAESTWRRLAILAAYLNTNASTASGPPRTVAGHAFSSTDLVLHELWPLASQHRVWRTERTLTSLITLVPAAPLWLDGSLAFRIEAFLLMLIPIAVVWREPWPQPGHIYLRSLGTRAGWGILALGFVSVLVLVLTWDRNSTIAGVGMFVATLAFVLTFVLAVGIVVRPAVGSHASMTTPRDFVRGDLAAALGLVLAVGVVTVLATATNVGVVGWPSNGTEFLFEFLLTFSLVLAPALVLAFLISILLNRVLGRRITLGSGRAALRYFAFLLCVRGQLPWRLGRFLDACYRLGILRVAGAAWQFRHHELQDHLATRPVPPSRT
ncbi:hypothetical protein [Streptomyces sp. NPDC001970]